MTITIPFDQPYMRLTVQIPIKRTLFSKTEIQTVGPFTSTCREIICRHIKDNILPYKIPCLSNPIDGKYLRSSIGIIGVYNEFIGIVENTAGLAPLMDYIVGNTCVLLDRDQKPEKGRARKFIVNDSMIEYEVSNFWFISYQLTSFVLGMARLVNLIESAKKTEKILSSVSEENIINAIDNNDFDLAMKNFNKIIQVLIPMIGNNRYFPLTAKRMDQFYYLIDQIKTKGISTFFKSRRLSNYWRSLHINDNGWESFIDNLKIPKG